MKKIGIITFHASHNYGSVLQAYALQKIIKSLCGYECEIINFRTPRQKDQYTPLTKRKGLTYVLKNGYFLLTYQTRKRKYDRFEAFIENKLTKSDKEYSSLEELTNAPPQYDYYISGSDQIWNTRPLDADMAYFLPFVKNGKRIAYAPSFGQIGNIEHRYEIANYLRKYDSLSIREEFGRQLILEMTGQPVPIMPDPTMLLGPEAWDKLARERLIKGDYIFFYTLFATKEMIKSVKKISELLHMPVVISNISNQHDMLCPFQKRKDTGPLEFLSLVKYAKAVVTSSFHGTVFSMIYEKPFLAYKGMEDNRISTLLKKSGLESRTCDLKDIEEKANKIFEIDYSKTRQLLEEEREKAVEYLKTALEIE